MAVKGMEAGLQGHRQITDAYLLALAHRRKGVLVTFDRGFVPAGDVFPGPSKWFRRGNSEQFAGLF